MTHLIIPTHKFQIDFMKKKVSKADQGVKKTRSVLQSKLSIQKQESNAPSLTGTSIPLPVVFSNESGISATVFFEQDSFLLNSKNLESAESLGRQLRFSIDPQHPDFGPRVTTRTKAMPPCTYRFPAPAPCL